MGHEVALGVPVGVHSSMQGHTSAAMPLLMSSIQDTGLVRLSPHETASTVTPFAC